MTNDILTQHGMNGLRARLEAAIPDDVALFYDAMLQRVSDLMSAQAGTRDGLALDILASGIEAYEKKAFPFPNEPQTVAQPIATAPKDGTEFVGYENGDAYKCCWRTEEPDEGPGYSGWWDFSNQSFENPTEWSPMPSGLTLSRPNTKENP
jgi:hypothetical protein